MAQVLYVSDDLEVVITPVSSGEVSICKEWIDFKLRKEIHRGTKLRRIKPAIPRQPKELRLVDINRANLVVTKVKSLKRPSSPKDKCPTRIMQLAAPSKRHCIATWRHKADKLPPDMLERLRMYVNDELPVIQVSEALANFQTKKKSPKREKKQEYKSAKCNLEAKKMCTKFGDKIAQKLFIPLNVNLNEKWSKVANEVNNDIANLMKKCVKQNKFNKGINEETANKITVWIADILNDSEKIQLERDMKDLDEEEGPLLDFVDDLIDEAVKVSSKIGIEKVESQIKLESSTEENSKELTTKSSTSTIPTINGFIRNNNSDYTDEQNDFSFKYNNTVENLQTNTDSNMLGTSEDVANITLDNVNVRKSELLSDLKSNMGSLGSEKISIGTDNITNTSVVGPTSIEKTSINIKHVDSKTSKEVTNQANDLKTDNIIKTSIGGQIGSDKISVVQNIIKDIDIKESNTTKDINSEIASEVTSIKLFKTKVNNINGTNISDAVEPLNDLNSDQIKNKPSKTITLSLINISNAMRNHKESLNSYQGRKIQFSSPKPELLTDADENWPTDLDIVSIKASQSVLKLVASLSKINENDDKNAMSPDLESLDDNSV